MVRQHHPKSTANFFALLSENYPKFPLPKSPPRIQFHKKLSPFHLNIFFLYFFFTKKFGLISTSIAMRFIHLIILNIFFFATLSHDWHQPAAYSNQLPRPSHQTAWPVEQHFQVESWKLKPVTDFLCGHLELNQVNYFDRCSCGKSQLTIDSKSQRYGNDGLKSLKKIFENFTRNEI